MADLTIAPALGGQTTTQNPQTPPQQNISASTTSGGIQPGTAASALVTHNGGIGLQLSYLTTVNLNPSTQASTTTIPTHKHVNYGLFGISIVLILAAVLLFWLTARSAVPETTPPKKTAKKTTKKR